jgi:hypothetical protein
MSDQDNGREAWEREQSRLSTDAMQWYRQKLADPSFQRDHPEAFAALTESVNQAIAGTGQSFDQPADGRSDAQRHHDARFGVMMADGKPQLPANLVAALDGEADHDPHETAFALERIGRNYRADYEAATRLLAQTGSKVDAARLSAAALSQLAIFSEHLVRHQKGRPS